MAKHPASPEALGYHVGSVAMGLTEGTTDQLETILATQGQVHSLLRGWSAAALGYVTVALTSDGKVQTSSTGGSGGSTAVDATLSSAGSTRLVGQVTVANPTTEVSLAAGSSNVTIGAVAVLNGAGGSTTVDANLSSGGSTKIIGLVDGVPLQRTRTTANASVDTTALAANANRRAALIQNGSTAVALLVNLSTVVVTSASYDFQIPVSGFIVIGGQLGNVPLYTGGIHIKTNSTALARPAFISEFTA